MFRSRATMETWNMQHADLQNMSLLSLIAVDHVR